MAKSRIRTDILARRRALDEVSRSRMSLVIQEALAASPEFRGAEILALYSPVNHEVRTDALFGAAVRAGKKIVFPKVRGEDLEFYEVRDLKEMKAGHFRISEPTGGEVQEAGRIGLMVIPGLAFDRQGHRLGYGRGFYDRLFHGGRGNTCLVGLCYHFQLVDRLPVEEHDVRMDVIITENQVLRFSAQGGVETIHTQQQGGPRL